MFRLNEPHHTFLQSLDDCMSGVAAHMPLRGCISNAKRELLRVGEEYSAAARVGNLCSIAPFRGADADIVLADISKGDLVKVYDQYFVPETKIARRIYNSILSAALEKCPFCGGIGTPRNLDHFLPKAFFPQFSVLPLNLVPSCRDCNMEGKAHGFAVGPEEQPIQPYLDQQKFFSEQWISANYQPGVGDVPGRFDYFASPPAGWPAVDKSRVARHFEQFDLAKRYSVKAAEHLATVLTQMDRMKVMGLNDNDVEHVLLRPGLEKAPFPNHWQRGMFEALIRR